MNRARRVIELLLITFLRVEFAFGEEEEGLNLETLSCLVLDVPGHRRISQLSIQAQAKPARKSTSETN